MKCKFGRMKRKCNPKPWKFQDWKPTLEQIQAMYWENEQYYVLSRNDLELLLKKQCLNRPRHSN
jgi:hypothetical protein